MTAAQRKLKDSTNGTPPYDALAWQREANTEVGALWKCVPTRLTSVAGTNDITAASDTALVIAITAYAQPMAFWLTPANTNTGGVTINIDGVGVKNLKDAAGATLAGGDLVAGTTYLIWYDGTGFRVIGGSATAASSLSTAPDMILRDEKTTNTAGGTFTSGAWAKRTLNTAVRNVLSGASLSASQFTLQAGTYFIEWSAPAIAVNRHQTRLYNATDATTVETGTSEDTATASAVTSWSRGCAVVTITSAKVFELDHICQTTAATNGFGEPTNLAAKEVYAWVNIWKVGTLASSADGIPGGGVTWQQNFSTTTADADPGNSTFRLNNATQNAATQAYFDLSDVGLTDITALLGALDDLGSSAARGYLKLVKYDDPTKWLVFLVTGSVTTASGYRKLAISSVASSAASPLANGDRVNFSFTPSGVGILRIDEPTIITGSSATIAASTMAAVVQRTAPATTALTLPKVADQNGLPLKIVDWSSSVTDHQIALTPDGLEKVMNLSSWVLYSTAASLASVTLIPSTTLNGWYIAP